ncbi:MAG: AAA family ATPase [Gammaproteobacteria bacterium]|nr:AAA family ATPase [Gammaproteobacteria bacterium]
METNKTNLYKQTQQAVERLDEQIIGQERLVRRLVMALLCGGHLLVEGAPGLAKTRAIKKLARIVEGDFHRIQFTPDLLPSDVTGTEVFRPQDGSFNFQHGPIFHNLILADEINRAPAKVQSALLEAMAESQVSIGRETLPLPDLFLVMATQNPIEQEGTYPLPEAQLDRFLLHVEVGYPDKSSEESILKLVRTEQRSAEQQSNNYPILKQREVFEIRKAITELHMAKEVECYIIELILESRKTGNDAGKWLEFGASPRGTIALDQCARCSAWMDSRDFVTPEDVQSVAHDVLRHRLILNYEAHAAGIPANYIIDDILQNVPAP